MVRYASKRTYLSFEARRRNLSGRRRAGRRTGSPFDRGGKFVDHPAPAAHGASVGEIPQSTSKETARGGRFSSYLECEPATKLVPVLLLFRESPSRDRRDGSSSRHLV